MSRETHATSREKIRRSRRERRNLLMCSMNSWRARQEAENALRTPPPAGGAQQRRYFLI
jgi:hypothetical protein